MKQSFSIFVFYLYYVYSVLEIKSKRVINHPYSLQLYNFLKTYYEQYVKPEVQLHMYIVNEGDLKEITELPNNPMYIKFELENIELFTYNPKIIPDLNTCELVPFKFMAIECVLSDSQEFSLEISYTENSQILGKEHVAYLLKKNHNFTLENDYTLHIIDNNGKLIQLTNNSFIELKKDKYLINKNNLKN
jgi:hypothetical protein